MRDFSLLSEKGRLKFLHHLKRAFFIVFKANLYHRYQLEVLYSGNFVAFIISFGLDFGPTIMMMVMRNKVFPPIAKVLILPSNF